LSLRILLALPLTVLFAAPAASRADIYRFVTVDGVEIFTDAPVEKGATLVSRDPAKMPRKKLPAKKRPASAAVSINEIVEKTVTASLGASDPAGVITAYPPLAGGTITSGVGMRIDPIDGAWRQHNGVDVVLPEGTPVRPAAAGVVVYSGKRPGYGFTVLVEHADGLLTLYGHNSRLLVSPGQQVDADTVIALSGNSGRSTGPHLHFEAWRSGCNITTAFLPGSPVSVPAHPLRSRSRDHFRREVLADGSILFTNLPQSSP
jgi:murein DD-endopeptidase MepM/ murein hydrolase activator NlpD